MHPRTHVHLQMKIPNYIVCMGTYCISSRRRPSSSNDVIPLRQENKFITPPLHSVVLGVLTTNKHFTSFVINCIGFLCHCFFVVQQRMESIGSQRKHLNITVTCIVIWHHYPGALEVDGQWWWKSMGTRLK
jgi:hypothetical protein